MYRGDTKTLRLSVIDKQGNAVDTTGWLIDFTLRLTDDNPTELIRKTSSVVGEIDAVDEAGGVWDVKLLPADTGLPCKTYVFDLQGTAPAGEVYTLVKDSLIIDHDVTR